MAIDNSNAGNPDLPQCWFHLAPFEKCQLDKESSRSNLFRSTLQFRTQHTSCRKFVPYQQNIYLIEGGREGTKKAESAPGRGGGEEGVKAGAKE